MAPVLEIDRLAVGFFTRAGVIEAVRDVSFSLQPGERLGLVGESGSGKTTTALAIMGLLRDPGRVSAGRIVLDGRDLVGLDERARARLRLSQISYVPQGAMNSLNPVLRVRTSIAHALRAHGLVLREAALRQRVTELLAHVGLPPEVAQRYPHELSGGMKQRVCIAIAISLGPRIIIADEPTSALDVVTQRQVMRTLHAAQDRLGSAMILIGHDMGLMAQSVDRIAVMRRGALVELGEVGPMFRRATHPYTAELIRSVPVVGGVAPRRIQAAPGAAASLLAFENVSKTFGAALGEASVTALHPLTFAVSGSQARIVSIVGQSGSGKTTLGSLVLGFAKPSTGRILWQGRDVAALSPTERRAFRRDVQAVFQDPYSTFNPFYRVARSLTLPLLSFRLARSRAEAHGRAEEACRHVGLDPGALLDRFPHQLSGGQRQRLMVARALLLRPRLLVADEPVSMVDASQRAAILDLLTELRDRHGITILYITHDLGTAYRVSDEVLVLHKGRVVEAGAPDAVLGAPAHPYTKLLIECLPWPDPSRPWGDPADETHLRREIEEREGQPTIVRGDAELMLAR